jgi:chromosome segregation ATPase
MISLFRPFLQSGCYTTRALEEEHEIADLRSKISRLRGDTSSLCVECDGARDDVDHLQDEGSQLGEALRGVKSHAELTKSSSQVEARLVQVDSEHVRERNTT